MLNLTGITVRLGGRTIIDDATAKLPPRGQSIRFTTAQNALPVVSANGPNNLSRRRSIGELCKRNQVAGR